MKWDNVVFFSELVSMMFLTFMALQTFYMVKKYKVEGFKASLYNATFIALALIAAIVLNIGVGGLMVEKHPDGQTFGFVNPSAALLVGMSKLGTKDFFTDFVIVAILANLLGGMAAGVLHGLVIKFVLDKSADSYATGTMAEGETQINVKKSILGELFASAIFFTTIVLAVPSGSGLTPLIVGIGLFLAILATGNYAAMLNPGVGLGILVSEIIAGKKSIGKNIANYFIGASLSFTMAAAIGGIAYAVTLV